MIRSETTPRAGASLAHMLEERRRLRRNQVLLEGALRELQEEFTASHREKRRQEARSGWCGPDLARKVDELRVDLSRVWNALFQVRQAIDVASQEVDLLMRNRWLEGCHASRLATSSRSGRPLPRLTSGRRSLYG